MTKAPKKVAFETYDLEILNLMKLLRELGIHIADESNLLADENKAFQFLYYALFSNERPAKVDPALPRIQAGLGDLATKINKAWVKPGSQVLRPHLVNMVRGEVRMNDESPVTDQAANKTCELYVGCLALARGWSVALDDTEKSSGGKNPDVILKRRGRDWSVAVKTIHGNSSQTIFDSIKSAVRQIENSGKSGIPFINLKNKIDQPKLLPSDKVFKSVEDANEALKKAVLEIIERLRNEIVDEDWSEAFEGKLARPLVAFMAQTLVEAVVSGRNIFVPIRMLLVLPVPPLDNMEPVLVGLDREAWDLLVELNDELQSTP